MHSPDRRRKSTDMCINIQDVSRLRPKFCKNSTACALKLRSFRTPYISWSPVDIIAASLLMLTYYTPVYKMHIQLLSGCITSLALAGLALGQNCGGTFTNHCVSTWAGPNTSGGLVSAFVPNCDGSCHNQRFESLIASGQRIALGPAWYTTRCHVYSQPNCGGNEILDTGNLKGYTKFNSPGAQSIKCYYRC